MKRTFEILRKSAAKEGMKILMMKVYKFNLVRQNNQPLGELHDEWVVGTIVTIGDRANKGKIWTQQGWEIADLINAKLVLILK